MGYFPSNHCNAYACSSLDERRCSYFPRLHQFWSCPHRGTLQKFAPLSSFTFPPLDTSLCTMEMVRPPLRCLPRQWIQSFNKAHDYYWTAYAADFDIILVSLFVPRSEATLRMANVQVLLPRLSRQRQLPDARRTRPCCPAHQSQPSRC